MRSEKASIVADLSDKLKRSPFVLVTDYQHMKVADFSELRNRLAPTGAEMHVVKNNFLKRAMADSGLPDVSDQLVGQTAVVTGENDVAPVAKIFKAFATEFKIAALKIGFVDRTVLSTAVERARRSIGAVVECKGSKGRKTSGGKCIEDFAPLLAVRVTKTKTDRVGGCRS